MGSQIALFLAASLALATGGCGTTVEAGACSSTNATQTSSVAVVNNRFEPACIRVPVGATVTWTNQGDPIHTVTSRSGAVFDSGVLGSGGTFTFKFTTAGQTDYVCVPHESIGMRGTVIVR